MGAYAVFDEIPTSFQSKILPKINEFNAAAASAGGDGAAAALTSAESEHLDQLIAVLVATSRYHSSSITPAQIGVG